MGRDCLKQGHLQVHWSWGTCSPVVGIILLQVQPGEGQLDSLHNFGQHGMMTTAPAYKYSVLFTIPYKVILCA